MSILTSASSSSVSRGYDYYKHNKVSNVKQLNDYEFEGYVDGSLKNPYYVKIDIEHPKKSYCDCPHANGNITCKHMTALYFELFPDEVDDYESWLNSDYDEDEEDDYYKYDRYYDDDYYYDYRESSNFEKPLFFDVVLEMYVDDLSIDQLKECLLTELKNNEKRTFELYLEKDYKKYLQNSSQDFLLLDKLNKKVQELTGYYNYDYNDFDKEILNVREKRKIEELYKNKILQSEIDKILLNEELSVYSDYKWIAKFYKKNKSNEEINDFCKILENYLDSLKHYSIKNTVPKSNVLIVIHLLNDFTITECANLILKNAKYLQYIDYVFENSNDIMNLYKSFMKLIEKNYFKNKMYIPDVLYRFVMVTDFENDDINTNYYLYSYLCLGRIEYLDILGHYLTENKIISIIENKTKDIFLLVKLYKFYEKQEKLWNLLIDSNYRYLLLDNIEILKDKYNDKLYAYFIDEFYNILNEGKSRENYHKASKYISAISKLNNGNELVEKNLIDLKNSDYQKCSALFDEINKAIKN
ncbi:MAG: SWIM zinc finger domain-containing protein [Bacilli bacterium]